MYIHVPGGTCSPINQAASMMWPSCLTFSWFYASRPNLLRCLVMGVAAQGFCVAWLGVRHPSRESLLSHESQLHQRPY